MRLLVVEDHEVLAQAISQAPREAGWAVDLTADGEDAALLVRRNTYDVIVLDLMLPGRDGLSVLRCERHTSTRRCLSQRHSQ